jgi:hypothetical protein
MRGVSALDFAMGSKNKKAPTNGWRGFWYGDKLGENYFIKYYQFVPGANFPFLSISPNFLASAMLSGKHSRPLAAAITSAKSAAFSSFVNFFLGSSFFI